MAQFPFVYTPPQHITPEMENEFVDHTTAETITGKKTFDVAGLNSDVAFGNIEVYGDSTAGEILFNATLEAGVYKYKVNGYACSIAYGTNFFGLYIVSTAPSGIAGNTITWSQVQMTSNTGDLGIGGFPEAKLMAVKDLTSGGDATGFRLQTSDGANRNVLFGGASSVDDKAFLQSYKEGAGSGVKELDLNPLGGGVNAVGKMTLTRTLASVSNILNIRNLNAIANAIGCGIVATGDTNASKDIGQIYWEFTDGTGAEARARIQARIGGSLVDVCAFDKDSFTIHQTKIDLIKGQIKFPSTVNLSTDANTLDDYREPNWTPTDGSGAGLSFTVTSATITKIGRSVRLKADITYPVTASGASARVTGFGFVPINADAGTVQTHVNSVSRVVAGCTAFIAGGATEIRIVDGITGLTNADLSGKRMVIVIEFATAF